MVQFIGVLYFLPCFLCVVWTFIYIFRVKNITQKMMLALLLLCTFYFATYAFYISPQTDYHVMAILDMFNVPVALIVLAVDLVFVWTHQTRRMIDSRFTFSAYIPAFVLSTINFVLVYLIGVDNTAQFAKAVDFYQEFPPGYDDPIYSVYFHFNMRALNYILLVYLLVIVYSCIRMMRLNGYKPGDVFRFFFAAAESKPVRVVCVLNIAVLVLLIPMVPVCGLGRTYLINHPAQGCVLTLLLSVTIFCLCYVEYMIDLPTFSLSSLANVSIGSHQPALSQEAAAEPAPVAVVPADALDEEEPDVAQPLMIRNEEQERVESALRLAFDERRVFLDPNLSIIDLASQLNTNRTTLSSVVSQTYGVNFRQLVARYRIEFAKRFMQDNPEAKQEEIAMECGFVTAQAFNQKFKELVGEAPRMWMVKKTNET